MTFWRTLASTLLTSAAPVSAANTTGHDHVAMQLYAKSVSGHLLQYYYMLNTEKYGNQFSDKQKVKVVITVFSLKFMRKCSLMATPLNKLDSLLYL